MMTWVGWCGGFLLILGGCCVLTALLRGGPLAKLRSLMLAVVLVSLGGLCLGFSLALRSFEAFTSSIQVAEVHCRWVGPKAFEATLLVIQDGKPQEPRTFPLRGDQWSISGGVVKWHPWLTALGVPSYHKPTRISGRYAKTAEETASPPTAFNLDGEPDRMWWFFYRLDPLLPFVEATYGSAAYTYVNPALVYEVFVTPSGYLIQQRRPSSRARQFKDETTSP